MLSCGLSHSRAGDPPDGALRLMAYDDARQIWAPATGGEGFVQARGRLGSLCPCPAVSGVFGH